MASRSNIKGFCESETDQREWLYLLGGFPGKDL